MMRFPGCEVCWHCRGLVPGYNHKTSSLDEHKLTCDGSIDEDTFFQFIVCDKTDYCALMKVKRNISFYYSELRKSSLPDDLVESILDINACFEKTTFSKKKSACSVDRNCGREKLDKKGHSTTVTYKQCNKSTSTDYQQISGKLSEKKLKNISIITQSGFVNTKQSEGLVSNVNLELLGNVNDSAVCPPSIPDKPLKYNNNLQSPNVIINCIQKDSPVKIQTLPEHSDASVIKHPKPALSGAYKRALSVPSNLTQTAPIPPSGNFKVVWSLPKKYRSENNLVTQSDSNVPEVKPSHVVATPKKLIKPPEQKVELDNRQKVKTNNDVDGMHVGESELEEMVEVNDGAEASSNHSYLKTTDTGVIVKLAKDEDLVSKDEVEKLTAECDIIEENKSKFYTCKLCNRKSNSEKLMLTHLSTHNNGRPFTCTGCQFTCVNRLDWEKHKRKCIEKNILCDICGETFSGKVKLNKHIAAVHPGCEFECKECGYKTTLRHRLKEHETKHSGVYLTCPEEGCNFRSVYQRSLDKHLRQSHAKDKAMCSVCGWQTKHLDSLTKHMLKHSSSKRYKCAKCKFSSLFESCVENHVRVKHLREKTYSCTQCPYKTVYAQNIRKHMLTHSGYTCSRCNEVIWKMRNLKLHMKQTHNIVDYKFPDGITVKEFNISDHENKVKKPISKETIRKYIVNAGEQNDQPSEEIQNIEMPDDTLETDDELLSYCQDIIDEDTLQSSKVQDSSICADSSNLIETSDINQSLGSHTLHISKNFELDHSYLNIFKIEMGELEQNLTSHSLCNSKNSEQDVGSLSIHPFEARQSNTNLVTRSLLSSKQISKNSEQDVGSLSMHPFETRQANTNLVTRSLLSSKQMSKDFEQGVGSLNIHPFETRQANTNLIARSLLSSKEIKQESDPLDVYITPISDQTLVLKTEEEFKPECTFNLYDTNPESIQNSKEAEQSTSSVLLTSPLPNSVESIGPVRELFHDQSSSQKGRNPMLSATSNDLGSNENSLMDESLFDLMTDFPRPNNLNRCQSASTLMFTSFSPHIFIDRPLTPDFFSDSPSAGSFFSNFTASKSMETDPLPLDRLTPFEHVTQEHVTMKTNNSSSPMLGNFVPSPLTSDSITSHSSLKEPTSETLMQSSSCENLDLINPSSVFNVHGPEKAGKLISFSSRNSAFTSLNDSYSRDLQNAVASIIEDTDMEDETVTFTDQESPFPLDPLL